MSRLVWDAIGEHYYETGTDHGVLYPMTSAGVYGEGVAWNGLTAVTESPSGAEPNPFYADNIKYLNLLSAEDFGATVEAYTYPPEFAACDGSTEVETGVTIGQQTRKGFGFCYRTLIGNDTDYNDHGYKIHIIYNALAAPSERAYTTVSDTPEPTTLSWEISTTPIPVTGHKPTAHLVIDSTKADPTTLQQLEDILYGTDAGEGGTPAAVAARLPLPDEIIQMFAA